MNSSKFIPLLLVIGILCVCVGVYAILRQPSSSLKPKMTVPKGPILGDATNGLYYKNETNSLESGVAYKFTRGERVYIYDGELLRPVETPDAYFRFYGCRGAMRVIDCAPVYEMPSSVTAGMLNGESIK